MNLFSVDVTKYPKLNLLKNCYIRTHKQTIVHKASLTSQISDLKADSGLYTKAQNKYFASFAATILSWGSRIFVQSLNIQNQTTKKALDVATLGLAISSSAYLGYNIYDYFKTVQNTTP